jgi:dephospho-CoA kinase
MIRVGLTGNMGTGKSIVCRIFETLGIPVYHSDDEAKKFLTDPEIIQRLVKKFGKEILTGSVIDRKKMAAIVFNNENQLAYLNSVIHPLVKEDLLGWIKLHQSHSYIIQEAAILFESGFYKEFDKIIIVVSPTELAMNRIQQRDNLSPDDIRKRMKHQTDQDDKLKLCDFVIYNDEKHLLIPQVLEIHRKLTATSQGSRF